MKKWLFLIAIVIVLILAWYLVSPLFINKTVNEDLPITQQESNSGEIQEEIMASYSGNFMDADSFHKVSGQALVIEENNQKYLRFEDFESTNGPDLKVYLAEDLEAESYVSLGELKGNIGNQNYEIPSNTDLEKYDKVLIWCEQFSVLFGSAELS